MLFMNERETAVAVHHFMAERDQLARHLGVELVSVQPGFCQTRLKLAPHLVNGLGLPHGAAIFALADVAFAGACNSHGQTALALSMDIHFLTAARPNATLTANAEEVHQGGRTALCHIKVTDDKETLIAELHGMAYRKRERFLETGNNQQLTINS